MGQKAQPRQPGPTADTLKLEGQWEKAVELALKKKPPSTGWPKARKKKGRGK
jgi:hypothetical protein